MSSFMWCQIAADYSDESDGLSSTLCCSAHDFLPYASDAGMTAHTSSQHMSSLAMGQIGLTDGGGVAAQFLEEVARAVRPLGRGALLYLAAAVSDFYLPWADMAEHKMQSSAGDDTVTLQLRKVNDPVLLCSFPFRPSQDLGAPPAPSP